MRSADLEVVHFVFPSEAAGLTSTVLPMGSGLSFSGMEGGYSSTLEFVGDDEWVLWVELCFLHPPLHTQDLRM